MFQICTKYHNFEKQKLNIFEDDGLEGKHSQSKEAIIAVQVFFTEI